MSYLIVSPRLGLPGAPFNPAPGVNVQALLDAGFIVEVSTTKPKPAPKVKKSTKE
jgi:hypothetical protein